MSSSVDGTAIPSTTEQAEARLEALPSDEHWKEQFAFVSGTVLVWGVLLVKMWPSVARFQTGMHVHFWSGVPPGEMPQLGFLWFTMLTLFLALGISCVFFSVWHMVLRGMWLGLSPYGRQTALVQPAQNWFQTRAHTAYSTVFFTWFITALWGGLVLVMLLASGIELLLRAVTDSTSGWLRLLSWIPILLISTPAAVMMVRRWRKFVKQNLDEKLSKPLYRIVKEMLLASVAAVISWCIATEMCYTVDLSLGKKFVTRSTGEYAEVLVRLGGATADPSPARLTLWEGDGRAGRRLALTPVGDGTYISYIRSAGLRDQVYEVVLTYPRYEFSHSYPFLQRKIERSSPLIVSP